MSKTNTVGAVNKEYRAMEVEPGTKIRPEPAVLTDNSLHTLAKEIDSDLRFIMLLCIPTTRIIQMKDDAENNGWPPSLLPIKCCWNGKLPELRPRIKIRWQI
ncbi:hypothetical protein EB796_020306 [Bugula neritina]|uniref:Uncharacterized protein n=1 Tax=Bugula neritina TaxID=10212 RepID=A0A7J7J5J6_BUGNE|nr:hypothetical protein EB796_020306 [Bugula neritina]